MQDGPEDAESATREALVDAAVGCFTRFGPQRTTMADVAKAAGVHRATVYRYFADRQAVVLAVLLRESRPIIERAARRLNSDGDVAEQLIEALVGAIADVRSAEHLPALFGLPTAADTARSATMSEEFVALAQRATVPALMRAQSAGALRSDIEVDDALRWLLRVAMSFLIEQPSPTPDEQRRMLRSYVIPALFTGAGRPG